MLRQITIVAALAAAANAIPQYGAPPEQPTPSPGSGTNSIELVSDLRVFCLEMCIDLAPNELIFNNCQSSCVEEQTAKNAAAAAEADNEFPAAIVGGCVAAGLVVIGLGAFAYKYNKKSTTPTRKSSKEADLLDKKTAEKSASRGDAAQPGSAKEAKSTPKTATASDAVVIEVKDAEQDKKAEEKVTKKAAKKAVMIGSLTQMEGYEMHQAAMQKEGEGEDAKTELSKVDSEVAAIDDSDDAASNDGDDAADAKSDDNAAADAKSDDDATDAKSGDDAADAKSNDDVADAKSGDDATDAKSGDDAADVKSGDDAVDAKSGDDDAAAVKSEAI